MSNLNGPHKKQCFEVSVGLSKVKVECERKQDVIPLARTKLSREVPRLWDMIHSLDDKEFRVDLVDPIT